jgi:acetyltransferase-like isoleucine patch superfamily enzyme
MPGQYIQAINGIIIGYNVRMGPGVKLISANHNLCNYDVHDEAPPIEIGDNCWLGANTVLLPGVKLGDHVVVAAGSVVTKSFPDNRLIGGVPACVLKNLGPYEGQSDW